MGIEIVAVIGVIVIVGVSVLAPKLKIAAPLVLVLIGAGISFIPGVPPIHVSSAWMLVGVLPPLLYAAAINIPLVDFRRNIRSIAGLSVALVLVSAFATGFLLFVLFPDLNLAGAIALGAVISPTDAVAATTIAKRLGLPHRLTAVIEGESLVNDATALVLLRSAVAATAGVVSVWQVAGDFIFSVVAAIVIGLIIGVVTVFLRHKLGNAVLTTAVSFVVPFVAYVPAEHIGASGVLSVVVAGLLTGHLGAKYFTASSRISERLNWRTVQFILENAVFLAMGLQIKNIIERVINNRLSVPQAILFGLLATALLVVLRFAFVMPLSFIQERRQLRRAEKNGVHEPGMRDDPSIGVPGRVVLSWSGMRGAVTLAAAQSLPESIPYRPQLILIAFTVAVVTLLFQGGTLPFVIRISGIQRINAADDQREFASLLDELQEAGRGILENPDLVMPNGERVDPAVANRVKRDVELRSQSAWERTKAGEIEFTPHQQYRELRREVLQAERDALIEARTRGSFTSHILTQAQEMLDLEEARLAQSEGRLD